MSEPAVPASVVPAPAIRRDGTVLGFDVGSRRIGVAIGSAFAAHARAVAVVDVHGNGPDWTAIERLLKEWKPDGLVVGDPLTLDGQDQPNRKRAQGFARQLRERFKLPVVMLDRGRPPLRCRARRRAQAPPRCGRPRRRGRGGDHRPLAVVAGRRHPHSLTARLPP
jgi:putative holliday junction resolvase